MCRSASSGKPKGVGYVPTWTFWFKNEGLQRHRWRASFDSGPDGYTGPILLDYLLIPSQCLWVWLSLGTRRSESFAFSRDLARLIKRSTHRLLTLLASLPVAVLVLGSLYQFGMAYLESNPRTLWQSLEWASETLTTTGYGADSRWQHPVMNLFVILTQFSGLFLVFLIFPIYVLPYFEERFESKLPRVLPAMQGRVLFYRYGPAVDSLIDELHRIATPFVILEENDTLARQLRNRGYPVVLGELEEQADLLTGIQSARALVSNAEDHSDATFIMMAREQGFSGLILALAEDPLHRAPMLKIGATAVFTPTHVLGAALAARASARISPRVEGLPLLGEHVGLTEFRVQPHSPLVGRCLGDLHLREDHGVTLIGQWREGQFTLVEGSDTRIESGAILVAVGAHANLARVEHLATPLRRHGPIVVAGYDTVGKKVVEMVRDAGETAIVIDERMAPGVDVIGNVLVHATLEQARIHEASAIVLALSNDSAGVFAAAVIRDFAPDVQLIARVNRAPNVARLYQAGADFALSVSQVAGQILSHHILGEDAVTVEHRLKFVRVAAGRLAGTHPWQAGVPSGAAVVAVERGQDVFVEFDSAFRVHPEDVIFVCGTRGSLDRYLQAFDIANKS
ncbi:putative Trk active potasium channel [Gammaproteobacteria bacterium]